MVILQILRYATLVIPSKSGHSLHVPKHRTVPIAHTLVHVDH